MNSVLVFTSLERQILNYSQAGRENKLHRMQGTHTPKHLAGQGCKHRSEIHKSTIQNASLRDKNTIGLNLYQ